MFTVNGTALGGAFYPPVIFEPGDVMILSGREVAHWRRGDGDSMELLMVYTLSGDGWHGVIDPQPEDDQERSLGSSSSLVRGNDDQAIHGDGRSR